MARQLMFQGTGSSVGKSIMVAAICRILNNKGIGVAPFKSQNMSLNAYITEDGKEMGRAQAVQAESARIKPSVQMNPILLKPTSDVGSQVILNGIVYKNMAAGDYFSIKEMLIPEIKKAYDELAQEYEAIIIEGAGSPAEINLRSRDVVNMGLAELVDTDVVLIGDVDKGGVFASLYGTFLLLSESERTRVKGFIINKFRGDVALLLPGVDALEKLIDRPCLGIVPFIESLKVDDEDSVTERFKYVDTKSINIGVVKLPFLSNFTDFSVFDGESDIGLTYLHHPEEMNHMDMVIIPGSKNTLSDMKFLMDSNFSQAIYRAHRKGVPIIGICGGYQMLGHWIEDQEQMESNLHKINGLGLLDVHTHMTTVKTTQQSEGCIQSEFFKSSVNGQRIKGYEIHMGQTEFIGESLKPFILTDQGTFDGAVNETGNIMGTYFHGIFDNDSFRSGLLNQLRKQKGLALSKGSVNTFETFKQSEYDRLAEHVEKHLDMEKIMEIMGFI